MAARGGLLLPLPLAARVNNGRRLSCGRAALSTAPVPATATATAIYPPLLPSRTAKSKAAKRRREEEFYQRVHDSPAPADKLQLLNKLQRLKYVVSPQTTAIGADRWYQHFTKTAFVPGLPAAGLPAPLPAAQLAELRSLVSEAVMQEQFYLKRRPPFLYREREQTALPLIGNLVPLLVGSLVDRNPLLGLATLGKKPLPPIPLLGPRLHRVKLLQPDTGRG